MSNLPPPGPPGPSGPSGPSGPDDRGQEPPYGSVPDPDRDVTQPAWSTYQPGQPAAYGTPQQPYGGPVQPYGYGGYPVLQSHGTATTSMVLGIVSIAIAGIGILCYGVLSWIALITGPIGIVLARKAVKEIDAAPGQWNNRGHATAGLVCSIVGTAVGALITIFWIIIVVILIATET